MSTYTGYERPQFTISLPHYSCHSYLFRLVTGLVIPSDTDFLCRFLESRSPRPPIFLTLATAPMVPLDSKMFVGGLNWDTTDGIQPHACNVTFYFTNCPLWSLLSRRPKELFFRVRQGNSILQPLCYR